MTRGINGKDFAIGVLSVTAVVLLTCVVLLHGLAPRPVLAAGQGGATGDYVVSTARLDDATEVVFVVDTSAQLMNMYGFLPARGMIELVQQFDLKALEAVNRPAPLDQGPGGRERPGRRNR
ncbi:MAG: hypothetical protein AMXMBFR83_17180 [Phycisphaerae bacterium]